MRPCRCCGYRHTELVGLCYQSVSHVATLSASSSAVGRGPVQVHSRPVQCLLLHPLRWPEKRPHLSVPNGRMVRYVMIHTGVRLKWQESCLEHSVEEKKPAAKNPLFYFKTGSCSMSLCHPAVCGPGHLSVSGTGAGLLGSKGAVREASTLHPTHTRLYKQERTPLPLEEQGTFSQRKEMWPRPSQASQACVPRS